MLLLFEHTGQGNKALRDLDEAGVAHEAVLVVGDLGEAVSQPGARRHGTLDVLRVPVEERDIFMETIRSGGGVLAVDLSLVDAGFVERVGEKHGAMRVMRTAGGGTSVSHSSKI